MLPSRALGGCERVIEMGTEHARNRKTFGVPIAERQAIQWVIADSAVEVEVLRWLCLVAAWQVDQGIDSRQAQSMAKLFGGVHANRIITGCGWADRLIPGKLSIVVDRRTFP
ncbi:acyl-CoA dehydrogenase family protein [Enemella dayhoffiae]|uniref:acyl-CoA dehydrogenase family protein n=1 Tax=Enemella dayhoffiae TaxID=2016507 RepID=UPI001E359E74|nr:acyl-CoA dehydrogenase family protein [Enemella dayhoffiae]